MHRTLLLPSLAFVCTAFATAQVAPRAAHAEKIPGAVKNAGIYHLSTGTWTRAGGGVSNFGPDVIYSNTAWSGYFSTTGGVGGTIPMAENFDEGQIPGPFNGQHPQGRDSFTVNCFEIGYCDLGPAGGSGWEIRFYESYMPCSFRGAPDADFLATGLPANGCWTVTFDLSGGNEFCLGGDGGDGYDGDLDLDSFGWSYTYAGQNTTSVAGFLIRGDPQSTEPNWVTGGEVTDGTDTYFGPPSFCPEGSTGLGTQDFWWIEDTNVPSNSGCYWFFGYRNNNACAGPLANMYASFHMELQADTAICDNFGPGVPYCMSNPNSTGVNSSLLVLGSAVVSDNNLTLIGGLPTNTFGFFITSRTPGFVANPAGSAGNLCVSANIGRFTGPGQIKNSGASGTISLTTQTGEWSLQSIPTSTGPYAAMAGLRTHFQLWHRDSVSGTPTSNFSDAVYVDWQ
ncbi:hypothetical protein Poly30_55890 [Planctomycetes bacterium Poly30]|uniref:Uncharacterized protein n=1 Tax=Saltatorellus ferox TaxID=2528018 RepID=A0A518F110_9BACT|nr:hypothetical protein Poly30_55890 [Planctomycetes bacterium Poly30]